MKQRIGFVLAVVLAAATLATVAAAAKGGKSLVFTFDDLQGDAIKSDGAGPYDASFTGRFKDLVMSTGPRGLFFDFSKPLTAESDTPFEGAATGWIDSVDLTVVGLDGAPGAGGLSATMEFHAPAPDGSGNTLWQMSIWGNSARVDEDGDGTTDVYVLDGVACRMIWWKGSNHQGHGGRFGADPAAGWTSAGRYEMPWGAVITKQ